MKNAKVTGARKTLLCRAEDAAGYPSLEFEYFYQQGMSCYRWRLPEGLKTQAFRKICSDWKAKGKSVALWQIKAFIYGSTGLDASGHRARRNSSSFLWPVPPDPSWRVVVCVYPDGSCDLDMVHAVSRAFWSEYNGFFQCPSEDSTLVNATWYQNMGFELLWMQPALRVTTAAVERIHQLQVVKR